MLRRVVFDNSFRGRIGEFPADAGPEWLDTRDFATPLTVWQREIASGATSFSATAAPRPRRRAR